MSGSATLGMICLFISINSNFSLKSEYEKAKGTEGLFLRTTKKWVNGKGEKILSAAACCILQYDSRTSVSSTMVAQTYTK